MYDGSVKLIYFCYTDGSSKKLENTPGGWGVFIRTPEGVPLEKFGSATKTDSETMELTAILEALKELPPHAEATFFSDSKTVLETCEKKIPVLRRNGWKNVPPLKLPLLQGIAEMVASKELKVTWTWIRGHGNNPGNRRAHELAAQGAREALKLVADSPK